VTLLGLPLGIINRLHLLTKDLTPDSIPSVQYNIPPIDLPSSLATSEEFGVYDKLVRLFISGFSALWNSWKSYGTCWITVPFDFKLFFYNGLVIF
jgi:hypothetical protein